MTPIHNRLPQSPHSSGKTNEDASLHDAELPRRRNSPSRGGYANAANQSQRASKHNRQGTH